MDAVAATGEWTLHVASTRGDIEVVRFLLQRTHTDPNATDSAGVTPLLAACRSTQYRTQSRVDVVRLLLDEGADATLAEQKSGFVPLHFVAFGGHIDLVDVLYSRAPALLNLRAKCGVTPLLAACLGGHERMVYKFLLIGAVGAIEGDADLTELLRSSVQYRQPIILRLLLTACGEERRSEWANNNLEGWSVVHLAAGYCFSAVVSILLRAGADGAGYDPEGRTAQEAIGLYSFPINYIQRGPIRSDPSEGIAIRRMLDRGPAYRARSWAWPCDDRGGVDGSGRGYEDTASAILASSAPVSTTNPEIGWRICRPMDKGSCKFFARLIGR